MIDVTLTLRNGDARTLSLPLRVADILVSPMPYFLSSGTADLRFETSDETLNEMLHDRIVGTLDGGIAQLNLLATLLEEMNKQTLAVLRENLPENLVKNSATMNELLGTLSTSPKGIF